MWGETKFTSEYPFMFSDEVLKGNRYGHVETDQYGNPKWSQVTGFLGNHPVPFSQILTMGNLSLPGIDGRSQSQSYGRRHSHSHSQSHSHNQSHNGKNKSKSHEKKVLRPAPVSAPLSRAPVDPCVGNGSSISYLGESNVKRRW